MTTDIIAILFSLADRDHGSSEMEAALATVDSFKSIGKRARAVSQ